MKYHFVREKKDIDYRYIKTSTNFTDILTKSLRKHPHQNSKRTPDQGDMLRLQSELLINIIDLYLYYSIINMRTLLC